MADDFSISYSYQSGPVAPPERADSALYAFAECDLVSLGSDSTLLLNRRSGRQMTVSPEVATALSQCRHFRTLSAHAAMLAASIPQLKGQQEDVTRVLASIRDGGILLEAGATWKRLSDPEQAVPGSRAPTRVFIITCDRPPAVARLLDSMLQAGNLSRHEELFLVDDSRDPGNASRNRESVSDFNRKSPKTMRYVGAVAQRELLERLTAAGYAAQSRFLLDRARWPGQKTYGIARNFCLLFSVGYRCIVLDDDVLCRRVLPPERKKGISFGGGDTRQLACFATEQELMASADFGEEDPLSGHAEYLGLSLGDALRQLGAGDTGPSALQDTSGALLATFDARSPLLVTQCGSWGDPGTVDTGWLYRLDPESVSRLLASPEGIEAAASRYHWLGRARPNIGKMAVMSQATGLDNTQLLPPYFPVMRGEDYLFAAMLIALHPHSAVLDYDWCVPHLPVEKRGSTAAKGIAARGGLALCARYLADRVDYSFGISADTRLAGLASQVQALGEQNTQALVASFRQELARERADQLARLKEQLSLASRWDSPGWDRYLRQGLEEVTRALQSPARLTDLPDALPGLTEIELGKHIQLGIREFGTALSTWQNLREAAAVASKDLLSGSMLAP